MCVTSSRTREASSLVGGGGSSARPCGPVLGNRRDHTGRRVADAEQPALALCHHLELDGALVEPGIQPLELAQRRPLRLADGLARRLDAQPSVTAARPFLLPLDLARLSRRLRRRLAPSARQGRPVRLLGL